MAFVVLVLGMILGSFLSAYTYRLPRNISIKNGRSKCPRCKKTIVWYDNIPLFSYLFLGGKSRCCKKNISLRYPLIEFGTGLMFLLTYLVNLSCKQSVFCSDTSVMGTLAVLFYLFIIFVLIGVFVIDLEHQIIPDELVFVLLSVVFGMVLVRHEDLYLNLLSGFGASMFLLFLNLFTNGKGMGLGDVKLAIPLGMVLGWPSTFIWLTISFVLGAIVGVFLIIIGKAQFGKHIPFGPFLVMGFIFTIFAPNTLIFTLI